MLTIRENLAGASFVAKKQHFLVRTLEREMPGDEVVFSNKVWCLLLGRSCLELAL